MKFYKFYIPMSGILIIKIISNIIEYTTINKYHKELITENNYIENICQKNKN